MVPHSYKVKSKQYSAALSVDKGGPPETEPKVRHCHMTSQQLHLSYAKSLFVDLLWVVGYMSRTIYVSLHL